MRLPRQRLYDRLLATAELQVTSKASFPVTDPAPLGAGISLWESEGNVAEFFETLILNGLICVKHGNGHGVISVRLLR